MRWIPMILGLCLALSPLTPAFTQEKECKEDGSALVKGRSPGGDEEKRAKEEKQTDEEKAARHAELVARQKHKLAKEGACGNTQIMN